MWAGRYWPLRYFASRYWPKVGGAATGTAVQVYGYVYMPTAIGGPVQMADTMRGAVDMVGAMHGKANML